MDLAIRPIEPDEFVTFVRSLERAFGEHLEPAEVENERLVFEADRSLAVLDGGFDAWRSANRPISIG